MMKKKIIPIALLTMFIGISNVNAYQFSVGYAATGQQAESKPREDIKYEWEAEISGNYKTAYTCKYNYTISVSKNVTINGYDMENNEIMKHSLKISDDNKILAGTSIGLNIYETKSITWTVTKAEVTYDRKRRYSRYRCTYKNAAPAHDLIPVAGVASINTLAKAQMIANTCSNKTEYIYSWEDCPSPSAGCAFESGPTWSHYTDYEYTTTTTPPADELAEKQKECTAMATKAAITAANWSFYSSYQIKLSDSNEVNGSTSQIIAADSDSTEYYKNGVKMTGCNNGACKFKYDADLDTQPTTESRTVRYYYKPNNVCINVKTSDITYRDTECTNDEMKIENEVVNGLEHWHYFVPLNAKSSDEIELNLLPTGSGGNLKKEECNYVMKNNPVYYDATGELIKTKTSYLDLIIPKVDGVKFEGNYCYNINGIEKCNENSSDYKEITNNGCYLTSKVKIPIEQKFYNEVEEQNQNIKFNGFNFYYRPISTTEPFPNGVNGTSLWKEWYESKDKEPDIVSSYNTITYIAQNIDANKVRKYKNSKNCGENNNEECIYTEWGNMNIDGTSGFIETEGIVQRGSNLDFYKLGCGPLNVDEKLEDGTENPLYIEGCGS